MGFQRFHIIFLALLLALTPLSAQEELLPDGAYGTTIHGGIKAGESKHYHLSGLRGQVLQVHLLTRGAEKGARLELLDSEGKSVLGGLEKVTSVDNLNLVLPKSDRYSLWVKGCESTCSYVLEVTLDDPVEEEVEERNSEPMMPPPAPVPAPQLEPPSPSPSPPAEHPSEDDL